MQEPVHRVKVNGPAHRVKVRVKVRLNSAVRHRALTKGSLCSEPTQELGVQETSLGATLPSVEILLPGVQVTSLEVTLLSAETLPLEVLDTSPTRAR